LDVANIPITNYNPLIQIINSLTALDRAESVTVCGFPMNAYSILASGIGVRNPRSVDCRRVPYDPIGALSAELHLCTTDYASSPGTIHRIRAATANGL
jgi:hypothetical protein